MTLIDIREHYNDQTGEAKPGKKGISLTEEQFQYILDHASEIKKAIDTKSSEGSGVFSGGDLPLNEKRQAGNPGRQA